LLLLIISLAASAQTTQQRKQELTGKVTGVVVDANDTVVSNAQVVIQGVGVNVVIAATQEGTFESELPVGIYTLIAVRDSRQVSSESYVQVQSNKSTKVRLILKNVSSLLDSIRDSHVEANVPVEADFDAFLKRDLAEYFKDVGKSVEVEYELLRRGPTQSGVAFPKFYVWVVVKSEGKVVEEGAARVAAIEKKEFEVVNYYTREQIERDTERIYKVFPAEVGDRIKEKLIKK
jgi:phenylpyruvate tautomerase PptA (4-oxalocrotonate tautomerase family)